MRIAIIGAGIAGLTTAWLVDETDDVTVYEAADRIGGHADTVAVEAGHQTVHLDLGAQHLPPDTFPVHTALRDLLGITDDHVLRVPLHTTMISPAAPQKLLVTPHAPLDASGAREAVTGEAWEVLGQFITHAVAFENGGDWTTTLGELTAELGLTDAWIDQLIHPWLASFVGCSTQAAAGMSARAAIAWITRTAPPAPDQAPSFHNLTHGMGHLADSLGSALTSPVRTGTAVQRLQLDNDGATVTVHDTLSHAETFDHVILAVQANTAGRILAGTRGYDQHVSALNAFDYVPATLVAHRDPAYMAHKRVHWSTNTVTIHDGWAETSTWYGPITDADLFKSWTTHREQPKEAIAQRHYEHLCVTPAAIRARTLLQHLHKTGPIHFVGSYLTDVDSQESAVTSALTATHTLTPSSPRVNALITMTDRPAG